MIPNRLSRNHIARKAGPSHRPLPQAPTVGSERAMLALPWQPIDLKSLGKSVR